VSSEPAKPGKTSSAVSEPGRPSLATIASLFFRIGNTTFGSGAATVVFLSQEMERRQWLARWQLDLFYAVARVVPGTNVLAFVAASAHAVRGWWGAMAAVLALSVPASGIVVLLTLLYERWHDDPVGGAVIGAAMAAIVGIIAGAAWILAWPRFVPGDRFRTAVLVIGAAALSFWISPLPVIALGALAGYFWPERE
jgi:chromate transporter